MNPFDLPGPSFLLFYLLFAVVVLVAHGFWHRRCANGDRNDDDAIRRKIARHPYLVAALGGRDEVIRVAVISLLERGLLKTDPDDRLQATSSDAASQVQQPLDKAILGACTQPAETRELFAFRMVQTEADSLCAKLESFGVLSDRQIQRRRTQIQWGVIGLLWGVALIKILLALSRGHRNIGLLCILAVCAAFVAAAIRERVTSPQRDRLFTALQAQFSRLKDRSGLLRLGDSGGEIAFLAALFGCNFLPQELALTAQLLDFPVDPNPHRLVADANPSSGSSCGSGCGSSCGSGCGGGGCGGCG